MLYRSVGGVLKLLSPFSMGKVAKNRHLGTIAQLRRAISSQLRHISTIGKKLVKQRYVLHMSHNMGNFGLLTAEIHPVV